MHTPRGKEETSIASEVRPASGCLRVWRKRRPNDIPSSCAASSSFEQGTSWDNPESSTVEKNEHLSRVEPIFPSPIHQFPLRKTHSTRLLEETQLGGLLPRPLNRNAPAESTCPLTNRPIQPRLIQIAASEESQTVRQKNQFAMRRWLKRGRTAAGRIFTLRSLQSAFTASRRS
jgi:hypothetical protein